MCVCAANGAMGELDAAMQDPASGWLATCTLHGIGSVYGASERRDFADKKAWHGTNKAPGNITPYAFSDY